MLIHQGCLIKFVIKVVELNRVLLDNNILLLCIVLDKPGILEKFTSFYLLIQHLSNTLPLIARRIIISMR